MARDYITVNTAGSAKHATKLVLAKDVLRDAYSRLLEIKAIMTHNNDGTVFTDIETNFGLPAGKGQTVFDLINGTIGAMEGTMTNSNAKALTETVG